MRRVAFTVLLLSALRAEDLNRLSFLSGCWSFTRGPLTIEEQWTRPAGGTLLGLSRTLRDGRTLFHEFLRIEQKGEQVVYTPQLSSGAKPVAFPLARWQDGAAVFENLDHDFPQRIIYAPAANGLLARIEGSRNGQTRSESFPYQRVPCP